MADANNCPLGGAHEWGAARPSRWAALRDWLARGGSWGAGYLVCQRCGSSDPLGGRTILVDGMPVQFDFLGEGPSWVGRGRIGNVVLTLTARNFSIEDAALVKIVDVEPYIQGGRDLAEQWRRHAD